MPLPEGFPSKSFLEKEGYETVEEVSEATDEELIEIQGIAEPSLAKIREVAPFKETGTGSDSPKTESSKAVKATESSVEPTAKSFQDQTSSKHKDQTDPVTGEPLPKGIVKNVRGTLSASSTVDQDDMVSPERIKAEHTNRLRAMGEKISAALEG